MPLSPYVCACVPSDPMPATLNVVCVVLSPQFTSTAHGLSGPGSLKLPRLNDARAPSLAAWFAGAATVGATLFTVSWKVVDDVVVPSFAVIVTVWLWAGPSEVEKDHVQVPAALVPPFVIVPTDAESVTVSPALASDQVPEFVAV